ncbi:MAG: 6-carboxytetrahydropterin synthase QueD [Alistipes sp.]|jgi:6-pyruvoyltetrahydropterin/6-carboxytetrahydropterin synthase|nr:6-carboxytetrahydropterin synthase QueD [Alistipes sp.]
MIQITKEFSFEMAHALEGHDGACSRIHGHSYRLWVTVSGEPSADGTSPKQGMVVDFGDLKRIVTEQIVDRFDHAFVVRRTAANSALVDAMSAHYDGVRSVEWQPTSENLVAHFADLLRPRLPVGVTLRSLKLSETATSFAELIFEN